MLPRKNDEHKTPVVRLGTACGLVGGCGSTTALRSFSLAPRNLRIGPRCKALSETKSLPHAMREQSSPPPKHAKLVWLGSVQTSRQTEARSQIVAHDIPGLRLGQQSIQCNMASIP